MNTHIYILFKGIVSGTKGFLKSYKWPTSICIKEQESKEPDFYSNVGAYAKDIWEIISKDGDNECQTAIKV